MIFSVNFDKWIALIIPTFLRRPRIFAFCRALCAPLFLGDNGLYQRFLHNRTDHIFRLSHNSQVCYLRDALNTAFDLKKGFEIDDADTYQGEWIFAKDPTMPLQLLAVDERKNPPSSSGDPPPEHPTPLLPDEAQLNVPHNAFIVRVPSNIYATNLDKVKAIVDNYRIPSKIAIYALTDPSNEQSSIPLNHRRPGWQWPVSVIYPGSRIHSGPDYLFASLGKNRR